MSFPNDFTTNNLRLADAQIHETPRVVNNSPWRLEALSRIRRQYVPAAEFNFGQHQFRLPTILHFAFDASQAPEMCQRSLSLII
jgi:hypothetical protein